MKKTVLAGMLYLAAVALAPAAPPASNPIEPPVLAPGYGDLAYAPPAPGTYKLPPLGQAPDGAVLKADGTPARLAEFFGDKLVLLSFIYSTCSDVNGCPLATAVLARIKGRLTDDPEVADNLRLVSISFDPRHDTPDVMRLYGSSFAHGRGEWQFLTTASQAALDPILNGYRQPVVPEYDAAGNLTGTYSHILRVFLIDRAGTIRNIYSVSFLHPDILLNDVKSLLLEARGGTAPAPAEVPAGGGTERVTAGDFKQGYDSDDYATASVSVDGRRGAAADLAAVLGDPPLGLPPVPVPATNPATGPAIALGRKLFFDRRLSQNNTISCAICHIPEQGFASNDKALAVGIEGRTVRRNAPTLYNVAYLSRLFHDGREYSLEHQVWTPLLARNMMGNPSFATVIARIRHLPDYAGLFEAAFDGKGPGMETIGRALASYQRTLVSGNAPFDRWHFGGDEQAVDAAVKRGFALFTGRAGCAGCHLVGEHDALFTDNAMHNTGLGWYNAMKKPDPVSRVQVSPGVYLDLDAAVAAAVSDDRPGDIGLYEVTQNPADRWRYRTPGLRNVALTAPYMHDGSLETLRDVVLYYRGGGHSNEGLDPKIGPLDLSDADVDDLVAFLGALTGDSVERLVLDAFAAPVGEPRDGAAVPARDGADR